MSVRTSHLHSALPRLLLMTAALFALQLGASAQGIGAHKGGNAGGGVAGGMRSIQGHIISPTGRLPETRIRVTVSSSNGGTQTVAAGEDGVFLINNLETGPYDLTIDAGKEFEPVRESVYIGAQQTVNVPIYLRLRPESNPAMAGVPKSAVDLYVKGQEAARKGDNDKAASLFGQAVAQHPQFGLAHNELGLIYMRTGKLDKALEAYKLAAQTLPEDPFVQLNYGTALTQKKEYAEAEKQLRAALKRLDKSAAGHLYLGIALIGLRNLNEAEPELQQAVRLGGEQMGLAHKYLGGVYWGRKEYKRAAEELETYLKLVPKAQDAEQIRDTVKKLKGMS